MEVTARMMTVRVQVIAPVLIVQAIAVAQVQVTIVQVKVVVRVRVRILTVQVIVIAMFKLARVVQIKTIFYNRVRNSRDDQQ